MTFEDDRTRQIRLGQSINLAISLAQNEHMGEDAEKVLERAFELIPQLQGFIGAVQDGAAEQSAVDNVLVAFPGSQVEAPTSTSPVTVSKWRGVQLPVSPDQPMLGSGPAAPAPQPAPVPGVVHKDEAAWREWAADRSAWWDNRTSKKGVNSPDFAHKARKNDKGYPVGLWLQGKFGPAPEWVFGILNGEQQF